MTSVIMLAVNIAAHGPQIILSIVTISGVIVLVKGLIEDIGGFK